MLGCSRKSAKLCVRAVCIFLFPPTELEVNSQFANLCDWSIPVGVLSQFQEWKRSKSMKIWSDFSQVTWFWKLEPIPSSGSNFWIFLITNPRLWLKSVKTSPMSGLPRNWFSRISRICKIKLIEHRIRSKKCFHSEVTYKNTSEVLMRTYFMLLRTFFKLALAFKTGIHKSKAFILNFKGQMMNSSFQSLITPVDDYLVTNHFASINFQSQF